MVEQTYAHIGNLTNNHCSGKSQKPTSPSSLIGKPVGKAPSTFVVVQSSPSPAGGQKNVKQPVGTMASTTGAALQKVVILPAGSQNVSQTRVQMPNVQTMQAVVTGSGKKPAAQSPVNSQTPYKILVMPSGQNVASTSIAPRSQAIQMVQSPVSARQQTLNVQTVNSNQVPKSPPLRTVASREQHHHRTFLWYKRVNLHLHQILLQLL